MTTARPTHPGFSPWLGFCLLLMFAVPALVFYMGQSSSLALGTTLDSVALLGFFHLRVHGAKASPLVGRYSVGIVAAVLVSLLWWHLTFASSLAQIDSGRAVASLMPLVLMLFAASRGADVLAELSGPKVHAAVRQVFFMLVVFAILAIAGLRIAGANASLKPVFPFVEPSHFALSFTPFLMYICVTTRSWTRLFILAVGLACAGILQNLTMAVGCLLVVAVSLRTWVAVTAGALMVVGIVLTQIDLSYFSDRINFSGDVTNLSTLVYIQGWQLIAEAWHNTGGWGLGFQQLGQVLTQVSAAQQIVAVAGGYLNLMDGGFVLAKFVSEFGLMGLIISIVFFYRVFLSFKALRRHALNRGELLPATVLAHCFVMSFLLELVVRGMGYFTPTLLAMLTALLYLHRQQRLNNRQFPRNSNVIS